MPNNGISSNFHWLTIKKRINMIMKNKTSRIGRFSYLLFIPVVALIIQSFSIGSVGNSILPSTEKGTSNEVPRISPINKEHIKRIS